MQSHQANEKTRAGIGRQSSEFIARCKDIDEAVADEKKRIKTISMRFQILDALVALLLVAIF